MGRKKKITEHYVDNEEFLKLLCEYKMYVDIIIEKYLKYNKIDETVKKNRLVILSLNYIENETDLTQKTRKKLDRVKNKIGVIFINICKGMLTKPNFINYTQDRKDDMISDACFYMTKYILKFDTSRDYPFSYFTTTANNAFKQYINKTKRYTDKFQPLSYIESMHKKNNNQKEDWD